MLSFNRFMVTLALLQQQTLLNLHKIIWLVSLLVPHVLYILNITKLSITHLVVIDKNVIHENCRKRCKSRNQSVLLLNCFSYFRSQTYSHKEMLMQEIPNPKLKLIVFIKEINEKFCKKRLHGARNAFRSVKLILNYGFWLENCALCKEEVSVHASWDMMLLVTSFLCYFRLFVTFVPQPVDVVLY